LQKNLNIPCEMSAFFGVPLEFGCINKLHQFVIGYMKILRNLPIIRIFANLMNGH
jgi:hypothetical protein